MLRKKITMVLISAFIVFSAIGALQPASSKGNPWDKVWETITQIQNRINDLETLDDHVYHRKFTDPTLHIFEDTGLVQAVSFTYTPENETNNALLNFWFYCEARSFAVDSDVFPDVRIEIIGSGRPADLPLTYRLRNVLATLPNSPWNGVWYWTRVECAPNWLPNANQESYTFNIKFSSSGKTEIRNINLIIEVMDGLPPT